jgi:PAS domain S-box-containing protein
MMTTILSPDAVLEQNYKQLFSQAPAPIAIHKGRELRYVFINEAYSRIFNQRDILNKTLREAFPELQGQGYYEILEGVFDSGTPYCANESPALIDVANDGRLSTRYYNLVYTPFKNGEGVIEGVMAFGHDVTGLVEARKKVEESEEKYRGLFESMDQGFCILEMIFDAANQPVDYRFLEVNPTFEEQTGLKEAVGKNMRELAPNLENRWFEIYGKVALTGEPIRFVEHAEALGRWFDVYAFRIGGGESRKVALLFSDITQRKQAEEALRESEERLQKVLSIETVGVIYFDLEGRINDANAAFERMSGYSHADIRSSAVRWDQLTPPEFIEATMKSKEEFLTTGQNTPYEKQYIRPDGSRWWGLFAGKRLSETEFVEFVVDITEAKQAEEELENKVWERTRELEKANEDLKHSNASLEEFAHAASHDLKEPVRKIHFFTDRLKVKLGERLDGEEARLLERMENAADRMRLLIDDLLEYSHVSHLAREVEEVDLNKKIQLVRSDLEIVIQEKGASFNVGHLPTIKGHRRQLQQLFQNLISNALKYSKPDEKPVISITAQEVTVSDTGIHLPADEKGKRFHLIQVADNGIGFDQNDAERIFQIFQRLHGKAEYSGTGVGLAIVKKVILNHGGYIWAESSPGNGATFKVLLPAS